MEKLKSTLIPFKIDTCQTHLEEKVNPPKLFLIQDKGLIEQGYVYCTDPRQLLEILNGLKKT